MRAALVIFVLLGASIALALPDGVELVGHVRKRFADEIKCSGPSRDANRAWCPVTKTGTQPLTLPQSPAMYLGLATSMLDGDSVVRQIGKYGGLAVLCLQPGKVEAKLTSIEESDDDRRKLLAPVHASVAAALADESKTIPLPEAVLTELRQICKARAHNAEDTEVDGTADQSYREAARLFRVGSAYVVLRESTSTRTLVAVVSVAPLEKK